MVLKRTDIACFVANWTDKAENIRQIAAMLNIGLDSLVFADDNPAERAIVRRELRWSPCRNCPRTRRCGRPRSPPPDISNRCV